MRLFTTLFALTFAFSLSAQLTNGGFEDWTNDPGFDNPVVDPSGFFSSNDQFWYETGITPVTEVAGVSGSALHLETIEYEGEVQGSFAIIGGSPTDDDLLFMGGFPFTDMAVTGISMDLEFDIDETSPGYVIVQFKIGGATVTGGPDDGGTFFFPVSGISTGWENTSFDFIPAITQMPDTVVIAFTSNDLLSEPATGFVGDFLSIDNLVFNGSTQTVPGGDMDTWMTIETPETPDDWSTFSQFGLANVESSDDAFEGLLSAKLTTLGDGYELSPGLIYKGTANDYGITADQPLPDDVVGFDIMYKYDAMPNDTALAFIVVSESLANLEDEIAFISIQLEPNEDWTAAQINWEWILDFLDPQYYAILITSSNFDSQYEVSAGSQLWVDAVDYYYDPNSCTFDPQILEEGPILCPNEIATLSVDEHDGYQWYKKITGFPGEPNLIDGETGQSLDINAAEYAGFDVTCACTLDGCTEFTDAVAVDGWAFAPPGISSDGQSNVCEGDSSILSNAFGTYATYQWLDGGVDIDGATDDSYWVTEDGSYTLTVTPMECPSFEMSNGVPVDITFQPLPTPELNLDGANVATMNAYESYAWYSPDADGTLISTNATLDQNDAAIVDGSVQVLVTDIYGCQGWSSIFTYVGLNSHESQIFNVSPNPTNSSISIRTGSSDLKVLEIHTLTGRKVISDQFTSPMRVLDLSSLESGVYLLSLMENGHKATQRVVKL
jgi:hypothetical protein